MKKTLAAIAVLGAFAGSALAADVTLYGRVDTGLQYNHANPDVNWVGAADYKAANKTSNKVSMESGQSSGSRWGLKGVEDLGAFKVGFILEDGFTSDDGAEKDVMFDRESSLFIEGAFGKLAVGKIGSIVNGTSSWAQLGVASPFGTSYGNAALTKVIIGDAVRNNMVAYQTPSFAGVKVFAQYGMGDSAAKTTKAVEKVENESSTDRYYALGATYANGPINALFAVDSINYATYAGSKGNNSKYIDDSLKVTAAVNYNFDVAKVYFGAQYFDEVANGLSSDFEQGADKTLDPARKAKKIKGYGLTVGADAPVAGGTLMAAVGYQDASAADSILDAAADKKAADFDLTRYQLAVGYKYNLSKRTSVYGAASMLKDKVEYAVKTKDDDKLTTYQAMFGLLHTF